MTSACIWISYDYGTVWTLWSLFSLSIVCGVHLWCQSMLSSLFFFPKLCINCMNVLWVIYAFCHWWVFRWFLDFHYYRSCKYEQFFACVFWGIALKLCWRYDRVWNCRSWGTDMFRGYWALLLHSCTYLLPCSQEGQFQRLHVSADPCYEMPFSGQGAGRFLKFRFKTLLLLLWPHSMACGI